MKKISVFAMAFMLSLLVFGCEEVENKDIMENDKDFETTLVEKIDLSEISAPDEVAVYSASFFDSEPEEVAHIFLGNDFEEGETYAMGRSFWSDIGSKKEKILYPEDDGTAYYGKNELGPVGYRGVNFVSWEDYRKICEGSDEYDNMTRDYSDTGRMSGEESDVQDSVFSDKQKLIFEYLEKLGVDGYEMYAATTFNVKKMKCSLMYFKPTFDGIPVSDILFENEGRKTVYNYRYSIVDEKKVGAMNADLQVSFLGDELIDFHCSPMINIGRQIKKYPLISVSDAYEQVKKCYPAAAGTDGNYELERAQLQYELLAQDDTDGKLYLYPVWIFGVRSKEHIIGEDEWMYYLVDAVTGEFFSDIPKELFE